VKNGWRVKLIALLVFSVSVGLGSVSYAASNLTLMLDDGLGHTLSLSDGQIGADLNPQTGAVTYMGSFYGWGFNVTTGLTYPVIGSESLPMLDLSSVNVTSQGAGSLTITLTGSGYVSSTSPEWAELTVGGTIASGGSVSFQQLIDGSQVASLGPYVSGGFSGSTTNEFAVSGPTYSLSTIATITHTGAGVTSFDAVASVPEPATILLLGVGLLGIGAFGRFKRTRRSIG
jgi:hypothetical protein